MNGSIKGSRGNWSFVFDLPRVDGKRRQAYRRGLADRAGQRRAGRVHGPGRDRDRGALRAEPGGDGRADAAAGPGDDSDLSLQGEKCGRFQGFDTVGC